MCSVKDSSAGCFINASGLHTNETVLNQVNKTDAVLAAELIEGGNQLNTVHFLAVNSGGDTLFKVDSYICSLIGSLFGRYAQLKEAFLVVLRLVCGILKVKTLVGKVPDVLILGVVGLTGYLKRNVVCLCVVDLFVTGLDGPFSPGSDDSHIGSKSLDSKLKSYLVVALTGAAVADSVSTLCNSDLSNSLCDDGTCKRGTEEVLALVDSVSLNGGVDIILNEFFLKILNVKLGSACLLSLFLEAVKLGALSNVSGNSDYLAVVVVFLEPGNNDRSVETAGISENDLFDVFLINCHFSVPPFIFLHCTPQSAMSGY